MQYDFTATCRGWLEKAFFAKDKKQYWHEWRSRYEASDRDLKFEDFGFTPNIDDLDRLPHLSFMLRIPFKLRKPYLSKDDRTFHLLDNPVRKDKVFQTPIVASTSWKGALRATLWQLKHQEKERFTDKAIERLFGNEREEEDHKKLKSGRLYFYPTFFNKVELEVINPHDRKTGTGKNPILIESVPIGATGEFVLLYVPFGSVKPDEVAQDLKLVAGGVSDMLTVYGFGAKTSSGFGVAELNGAIQFGIRADWTELKQPEPELKTPEPELPRYLIAPGQIDPDFLNTDGSLKPEADYLQGKSGKKAKQLYQKAKDWWEREGRQLAEAPAPESLPELEPPPPKTSFTEVSFVNWNELSDRTQRMAEQLQNRGEV
ncbi:RAMP superfamily CRISPR-associated protein [Leptolyngbyaceae cyanobacterium UHCC 1019]